MSSPAPQLPLHERAKPILFAALDLPAARRLAFVEENCAGDPALLEETRSLLERVGEEDGFLEDPLVFGETAAVSCPDRLGSFDVRRVLGVGGMGIVYLAQQQQPRRLVALKVLRLGVENDAARKRFVREAELLGRFSHPGLAKVFEAGVMDTDVGPQPFLSMEYVEGVPIDRYVEQHELDARGAIELILQVTDAVAHAHAAGVLHRDLKPDNVLVDVEGRVRVLDFGVAHVLDDELNATRITSTGQVLGTVAYMSPEQARGGRIDERCDVFAVGTMLYEMLTGELPYPTRGRLVHDALRMLAEGEWTPPSKYDSSLRGDLEAILGNALASEPARRYRGIEGFADDLRAWLVGRPVKARAPSTTYQLTRFIARHRALSVGVAVALLALGGGLGIALGALARAHEDASTALLFSDLGLLDELLREEQTLWPADSTKVAELRGWLRRADELRGRTTRHSEILGDVLRLAEGDSSAESDWRTQQAQRLELGLRELFAPEGLYTDIEGRLGEAGERERATLLMIQEPWQAAARRVARDSRFGGLELVPQEGLVPLNSDPVSGLEEFWLYGGSGSRPARDATTGELELHEGTGIVLVLIPGGKVWIGAQSTDPEGPHYDPDSPPPRSKAHNEGPPIQLVLDPFLLSKYEITQAQWLRLFGENPSDFEIGSEMMNTSIGPTHPVESLSHDELLVLLPRIGLSLPTEAQWETAARGGTTTPFVYGATSDSILGKINYRSPDSMLGTPLEPGVPLFLYDVHAPIGLGTPNPFGLHDILGNVWEHCLDEYKVAYHQLEHRAGDGLVLADGGGDVSRRGPGWGRGPGLCRVASRQMRLHGQVDSITGVRPARSLRD